MAVDIEHGRLRSYPARHAIPHDSSNRHHGIPSPDGTYRVVLRKIEIRGDLFPIIWCIDQEIQTPTLVDVNPT